MDPIVAFVFFAIVQVTGVDYSANQTMEECQAERAKVAARPDTLFVSECQKVILESVKSKV